ncbi:alpha/beta fold hydrolase [Nonomuraea fastidiosa]|jgi:pimeloyl-ACP methyl ester carboxylesterase|uniref:alpha/beta fold hydrolase n=1 Tax=Nonomuraea TaxID=83681 RepID=UPI003252333B
MTHAWDAIAAEWLKLRTLRSNALLLACTLLAVLACAAVAYLIGRGFDTQTFEERLRFTGNGTGLGPGLPIAHFVLGTFGALTITSEYATGMIHTSLMAVPQRQLLLAAKIPGLAAVTLPAGQLLAFAMHLTAQSVLGERAGQILLDGQSLGIPLTDPGALTTLVAAGLSMTAAALAGLGVGATLRSTPGSLVALALLFVVLPVAVQALPAPLRAQVSAYTLAALPEEIAGTGGLLPPPAAAALLAAYPLLALTAGATAIALKRHKAAVLAAGAALTLATGLIALPATEAAPARHLAWHPCTTPGLPREMRCADLRVPLDWNHPTGRTITIPLAMLPASGTQRRIGTVISIPGGPGASGIDDLTQYQGRLDPLRRRFDVISFAPRNAVTPGGPLPHECLTTGPYLPLPRNRAEYAALARTNRAHAERCRAADPELFDHMDSASVARDIDALRAALGEPRVNLLANSYGGHPAAAYARLFPSRIRALVMDGTTSHTEDTATGEPRLYQRAERQLDRFAAWCRTDPSCALHGRDVKQVWRHLVERADRTPIPVRGDPDGTAYTGFDVKVAAAPSFTSPGREPDRPRWVQLADAIAKAADGDASGFAAYVRQATDRPKVPSPVGQNMTRCLDGGGYTGYAAYRAALAKARELSPHFAGQRAWWALACAGWPAPVTNPPAPLPGHALPPVLGVGTWTDHDEVATTIRHVPGSSTIRYDGHGHMAYLNSSSGCVTAHVNRYLTTLRLPPPGTVCPATG